MNETARRRIIERFKELYDRSEMKAPDVAKLIEVPLCYINFLGYEKYWSKISISALSKMKKVINSGESLKNYDAGKINKLLGESDEVQAEEKQSKSVAPVAAYDVVLTGNLWQLCPKCNGTGMIYSFSAEALWTNCDVCNGEKIISTISGQPPSKHNRL